MPDGVQGDFSALDRLAKDFGKIARDVRPNVRKALEFTAGIVKKGWRENAAAANPGHAKRYQYSIDYSVTETAKYTEVEIGPSLARRQGALGILEEAPGGVRARPQGNGRRALKAAQPDFEKGLSKAMGELS